MNVVLAGHLYKLDLNKARGTSTSWQAVALRCHEFVLRSQHQGEMLASVRKFTDDKTPVLSLQQVEQLTAFFPGPFEKLEILGAAATKELRLDILVNFVELQEAWKHTALARLVKQERLVVFGVWTGKHYFKFRCPYERLREVTLTMLDLTFEGTFSRSKPLPALNVAKINHQSGQRIGQKRAAAKLRWLDLNPTPKKVQKVEKSAEEQQIPESQ